MRLWPLLLIILLALLLIYSFPSVSLLDPVHHVIVPRAFPDFPVDGVLDGVLDGVPDRVLDEVLDGVLADEVRLRASPQIKVVFSVVSGNGLAPHEAVTVIDVWLGIGFWNHHHCQPA